MKTATRTITLFIAIIVMAFTAEAKSVAITASDNAFAYKGAPDTDQDEAEVFRVKNYGDDGNTRIGYLRFDVSSLLGESVPGATIASASLSLEVTTPTGADTIRVYALKDTLASETTWTTNMTWNTRPDGTANLITATGNANTTDLLTSLAFSGSTGIISLDLTDDMFSLLNSDSNGEVTLVLSTDSSGNIEFASQSNTGGYAVPTLKVDYLASFKTVNITASDNAHVRKNEPAVDQNDSESVWVKNYGSDPFTRVSYIRFDVSSLSDPDFAKAYLALNFRSASADTIRIYAVNDGVATETSWTTNLTWNTRPDGTADLAAATGNANTSDLLTSADFSGTAPKIVYFDLTDDLLSLLTGDTNDEITLVLSSAASGSNFFASLTNTGGYPVPTLSVVYLLPSSSVIMLE